MSDAAALPARYTVAEYLDFEDQSPLKHEFVDTADDVSK